MKINSLITVSLAFLVFTVRASAETPSPLSEIIRQGLPTPVSELPPDQKKIVESLLEKYWQPAALTYTGKKIYRLSNSATSADIQKFGLTESAAAKIARLATSNAGRRSGVFLVAAGATLAAFQVNDDGTVSVIATERPWLKQYGWLIAIAVGIGAVLLYMKLQKAGIFRQQ